MTIKVYIEPTFSGVPDNGQGGIRRVVEAQRKYLPQFDVNVVSDIAQADITVGHAGARPWRAGVPYIAASHGLYWKDYTWHGEDNANRRVIDNLLCADAITVPSRWVRNAYTRGILREPLVIYHGVEPDEWTPRAPGGYVLWNKPRQDSVSDSGDMTKLAAAMPDVPFVATLGMPAQNVTLIGRVPYQEMHSHIERASVYLATARETFGIGTLEALAAGVPVAGWRYGGQREIIVEGETGYLATPGNYAELADAVRRCYAERARLGANARADVEQRWQWPDKIAQYAALFGRVLSARDTKPAVSVIVTCHNLAKYLPDALKSVAAQTFADWECWIVDDFSTDDTPQVAQEWAVKDARFRYTRTPENLKLSRARNFGFARARGRYVLNLDADDELTPDALAIQVKALEENRHLHIVYGSLDLLSEDGATRTKNPFPRGFNYLEQMAHLNQLYYAALMRREVWENLAGYRERMWRAEDASFWCRAVSYGFRAAKVTEEACLLWRFRADGKSASERRQYPDIDGPWTELFPWAIALTAKDGIAKKQANALRIPNFDTLPFGAPVRDAPIYHREAPLVSIVIPLGPGHLPYVIDALESCIAQTEHRWEAIVVNDSGEPLDRIPGAPYARIVTTGGRKGAGAARNVGIAAARAPLVLFLDADDMLHPDALKAMLARYGQGDTGYVFSGWRVIRPDKQVVDYPAQPYSRENWLIGKNEGRNIVTVLMATDDARRIPFDEQMPAYEDWDWFCKLAVAGVCGAPVNQILATYRTWLGQRSAGSGRPHHTELVHLIRERYDDYLRGAKAMAKCCGGNKRALEEIQAARAAMAALEVGRPAEPSTMAVRASAPVPDGKVRMRFTGDRRGPVTYYANGRGYAGANTDENRFVDALKEDVDRLASTGVWVRVQVKPPPPPPPPPLAADAPRPVVLVEPPAPEPKVTPPPPPAPVAAPAANPVPVVSTNVIQETVTATTAAGIESVGTPETPPNQPTEKPARKPRGRKKAK